MPEERVPVAPEVFAAAVDEERLARTAVNEAMDQTITATTACQLEQALDRWQRAQERWSAAVQARDELRCSQVATFGWLCQLRSGHEDAVEHSILAFDEL